MTVDSRPEPFSAFTTPEFWNDPHISQQMLVQHLDPNAPMASRTHDLVDRSVEWLMSALDMQDASRLLDLGCGPGVYAERFARRGIDVTGIDVSERSITYARKVSQAESLAATYRVGSYLDAELGSEYDAAILIFEDYCALSPTQRALLLNRIHSSLRAGGRFAFDVTSATRFADFVEGHREEQNLMNGFWADEPYSGAQETWTYPELKLVLERYTILTASATRQFWNWTQCLTVGTMTAELATAGFRAVNVFADLAGDVFDDADPTFALVAQRD